MTATRTPDVAADDSAADSASLDPRLEEIRKNKVHTKGARMKKNGARKGEMDRKKKNNKKTVILIVITNQHQRRPPEKMKP